MRRIVMDLRSTCSLSLFFGLLDEHLENVISIETLPDPPGAPQAAPITPTPPAPPPVPYPDTVSLGRRVHFRKVEGKLAWEHAYDVIRIGYPVRAGSIADHLEHKGYDRSMTARAIKHLLNIELIRKGTRGVYYRNEDASHKSV